MANTDRNLRVAGKWFDTAPEMKINGGAGGLIVRRTLNGKAVVVGLPNRQTIGLICQGGGDLLISKADAGLIWQLWSQQATFAIEAQGVGATGETLIAQRAVILARPELRYVTNGDEEGVAYSFTITTLD